MSIAYDEFLSVIRGGNFVVLDTETTGLHNAEACSIAIINAAGKTLLQSLIKPKFKIPAEATNIHKITNEMVAHSPTMVRLEPEIKALCMGKTIVSYNAAYDRGILSNSIQRWRDWSADEWLYDTRWACAMESFAELYGDWSEYHKSYTFQKLTTAARYAGCYKDGAHGALVDCQMTLGVVNHMLRLSDDHEYKEQFPF